MGFTSKVWQEYKQDIVDGPSFIKSLKLQMGEEEEYDQVIKDCKASHRDFEYDMTVVPVNFSMENRSTLSNCKMLVGCGL